MKFIRCVCYVYLYLILSMKAFCAFAQHKLSDQSNNTNQFPWSNTDVQSINCRHGVYLSRSVCLPKDYQKASVPVLALAKSLEVMVVLNVSKIDVNDKVGTITVELSIMLSWLDSGIVVDPSSADIQTFGFTVLQSSQIDEIWNPDITIYNMVAFQRLSILNPTNGYLKISYYPLDKEYYIYYLFDGQVTVYCNFQFNQYPMDKQECELRVGSHSYGSYLVFKFLKPDLPKYHLEDIGHDIEITYFETLYWDEKRNNGTDKFPRAGNIKQVGLTIGMNRYLQPFIMRYYLPCIAILVISQTSFLVPPTAIPGRVALLVTIFLTLTNIFIGQQVSPIVHDLIDKI